MRLPDLPRNTQARVVAVHDSGADDSIAVRLRELGFVPGELLRVTAHGPMGRDPLLVQMGYTRFALRQSEAARIAVEPADGTP